jgi:hypothetical protein
MPESPFPTVSGVAENTLLIALHLNVLAMCRNLQIVVPYHRYRCDGCSSVESIQLQAECSFPKLRVPRGARRGQEPQVAVPRRSLPKQALIALDIRCQRSREQPNARMQDTKTRNRSSGSFVKAASVSDATTGNVGVCPQWARKFQRQSN